MTLSRTLVTTAVISAAIALSACGRSHTYVSISNGNVALHHGYVTIDADNAPEATITSTGDLRIGSRTLTVDTNQRHLLRRYYSDAENIGNQGAAIGKAGARMAGGTISDVFRNLFSGHPNRIDRDVHKRTDHLLAKVALICDSLQSLQTTQDSIANQLEAFRPYARIQSSDVQKCQNGIKKGQSESTHTDN